jgi:uncharacterized repeat protein (TIGR01451 family)
VTFTVAPLANNDVNLGNVPGTAVSLDVPSNDVASAGRTLDPSSVDLDPTTPGQQTTLTVSGEGVWTVDSSGEVIFTPESGYFLDPTPITYTIADDQGNLSNVATITVDYVPVASDDVSTGHPASTPVTIPVLANDTTGDAVDPTTVQIVNPPAGSTLSPDGKTLVVPGEGTWTVDPVSGTLTFTPEAGFNDSPTPIQYTVQDDEGNTSNPATVTLIYDPPVSDLQITKTDGSATYTPGLGITYTIVVTNAGPNFVYGATVADSIPAEILGATWTIAYTGAGSSGPASGSGDINTSLDLAAGGTATFIVSGTVVSTATGDLVNTATVTPPSGTIDPNPDNNSATDTSTAAPVADLSIAKTNNVTSVVPGTTTTYTITVSNAGPSTVSSVTVIDTLPAALLNPVFTPSTGTYNSGTGAWTGLSLATGQSVTLTLTGTVDPTATGSITNTVMVSPPPGVTDPNPNNDTDTDTDPLIPTADLSIAKTNNVTSVVPGTTTTYTITVSNAGPSTVNSVTVVDTLPGALLNPVFTPSTGSYNSVSGAWTGLSLATGQSVTMTLTGTVSPTATGSITNTVTVSPPSGVTDPNLNNNTATDTDPLIPTADLSIAKTNNVTSVVPGTTTTYTITVSNAGPSTVNSVTVVDTLPGPC